MKPLRIAWLCSLLALSGCISTSQTSKEIAGSLINTAEILQNRHIETIDAYIRSIEQARADTAMLLNVIQEDKNNLLRLKKQVVALRADALVGKAIIRYEDRVQKSIFADLDDTIEKQYWPDIVASQLGIRRKADDLGVELKNHVCTIKPDSCSAVPLASYRNLYAQYRDHSVQAELILHYGYEGETKIWQKATEFYEREREKVKVKALAFLVRQPDDLAISNEELRAQLSQIEQNMDVLIERLNEEKREIQNAWSETKGALMFLHREISQPSVWELVLDGASKQTKSILSAYSGTIKEAVGGVFGSTAGQLVSDVYESKMTELTDTGVQNVKSALVNAIADATAKINDSVDKFNTAKSKPTD